MPQCHGTRVNISVQYSQSQIIVLKLFNINLFQFLQQFVGQSISFPISFLGALEFVIFELFKEVISGDSLLDLLPFKNVGSGNINLSLLVAEEIHDVLDQRLELNNTVISTRFYHLLNVFFEKLVFIELSSNGGLLVILLGFRISFVFLVLSVDIFVNPLSAKKKSPEGLF